MSNVELLDAFLANMNTRLYQLFDTVVVSDRQAENAKALSNFEVYLRYKTMKDKLERGKVDSGYPFGDDLSSIAGRIMTIIDSCVDVNHSQAAKDIAQRIVWCDYDNLLVDLK